jgi:hypothetical protein
MNDELPKKKIPAIKWYLLCSLIIWFTVSSQSLKPWEKNYQNHSKYHRSLHNSGNVFLPKSTTTRAKEMLGSNMSYTSWDLTGILLHGQYFFVNQFFVVLTVSFQSNIYITLSVCLCVCLSPSCKDACFFFLPMGVSVQILSSNLSCNSGVDVSRICLVSLCALFLSFWTIESFFTEQLE